MNSRFKATDAPAQTPEEKARWEAYRDELWTVGGRTQSACKGRA